MSDFDSEPQIGSESERILSNELIRAIVRDELARIEANKQSSASAIGERREKLYMTGGVSYQDTSRGEGGVITSQGMAMEGRSQTLGRWIVADPAVCHGKPTFRGTRIMVWQVLDMVAKGMAWETIVDQWEGKVTKDAISEAVRLANMSFVEHAHEYMLEPIGA